MNAQDPSSGGRRIPKGAGPLGAALAAGIALALWAAPARAGSDCTSDWSVGFYGGNPLVMALPDGNATYWTWSYERTALNARKAFRFTGEFPHARYASLQVYDFQSGGSIGHLRDEQIEPDAGSVNPYRPGVERTATNRSFTIWLVPPGSARAGAANTLVLPDSADLEKVLVIFRVYRADDGLDHTGGVGLPRIRATWDRSGWPASCPDQTFAIPEGFTSLPDLSELMAPEISFYRFGASALLPNLDNAYVTTQLDPDRFGEVAVLKYRAPTYPETGSGGGSFSGNEELRYYSFCLCGGIVGNVSDCVSDDESLIGADGYIRIAIGPTTAEMARAAEGWNLIPWGVHLERVAVMRHLAPDPDFAGAMQNVPGLDPGRPLGEQTHLKAENFVGDYAPTGRYCTPEEFIADHCGME